MIDWSKYAGHELRLEEVQQMTLNTPKFWGWANGMFIGGNDDFIALRFHNGHAYEPVTRELWRRLCNGAEFVADIGTHSGTFTLDAFRAGAKIVFSAEPHPINYARLVLNIRYNGFSPLNAFFGAIGDEDKVSTLLVKNGLFNCHAAGRVGLHNKNGIEIPIRVGRLDSLFQQSAWPMLRALKIDAENYTPNVLVGMKGIFDAGHRPDLIIECTESGMGDMLKALGYKFWRIWETGRIEPADDLAPHNPDNNYNGTDEDCRNRFASVRGLPDGA